jgi:ribosomal protein S18 acetylase RimI-like enzyme
MYYAKFQLGQEKLVYAMVWAVFSHYEAPDYPPEGVSTFRAFIAPDHLRDMVCEHRLQIFCGWEDQELVGVLAVRDRAHISLLFVSPAYHRRGIAKTLLGMALAELTASDATVHEVTVNSSPYAQEIYERMGFKAIGPRQQENGILYIPMAKPI